MTGCVHPSIVVALTPAVPEATGWLAVVYAVLPLVLFALAAAAIVSISRHTTSMSTQQIVLWCGVALLFTVIGPLLWFAIGRRAARARATPPPPPERAV